MTTDPALFRQPHSDNLNELASALAKAQAKFEHAAKSAVNPHFQKKYADLPPIYDASRAALAENGLAVVQLTECDSNSRLVLVTTLLHSSGQWMKSWYPITPVKNDPQGVGSAVTYARRYSYAALVGVASIGEDDDGNAASGIGSATPTPVEQPKVKPIFSSEPELITFQAAVRRDFAKAQNLAELNLLARRDAAVVDRLLQSPEPKEVAVAKSLAVEFGERQDALKAAPAKPSTPTVESVLGDDEIPF